MHPNCFEKVFGIVISGLQKRTVTRGLTTNPGFQHRFPIPQAVAGKTGSVEKDQFKDHLHKSVMRKSVGLDGMHSPVLMELAHVIARHLWIS